MVGNITGRTIAPAAVIAADRRSTPHQVAIFVALWCLSCTLRAEEPATSPPATSPPATSPPATSTRPVRGIDKLDKKSKAKVLAALAAFAILAFGMIALTWLGARVTRRYMNPEPFDHQRKKNSAPPPDDWAGKPLVDQSELDRPGD